MKEKRLKYATFVVISLLFLAVPREGFVSNLGFPFDIQAHRLRVQIDPSQHRIKAMISLDSIGGSTGDREVFLIGSSIHPSLAERLRKFITPLGLKEGQNIDRYAFHYGSDHYPFHQAGVPSLDIFASDYKRLHSQYDTLEFVDFDKLKEVAHLVHLTAYEFLTEL